MDIEKRLREIMTVEDPGVQVTDAVMLRLDDRTVLDHSGARIVRLSEARARRRRFIIAGTLVAATAAAGMMVMQLGGKTPRAAEASAVAIPALMTPDAPNPSVAITASPAPEAAPSRLSPRVPVADTSDLPLLPPPPIRNSAPTTDMVLMKLVERHPELVEGPAVAGEHDTFVASLVMQTNGVVISSAARLARPEEFRTVREELDRLIPNDTGYGTHPTFGVVAKHARLADGRTLRAGVSMNFVVVHDDYDVTRSSVKVDQLMRTRHAELFQPSNGADMNRVTVLLTADGNIDLEKVDRASISDRAINSPVGLQGLTGPENSVRRAERVTTSTAERIASQLGISVEQIGAMGNLIVAEGSMIIAEDAAGKAHPDDQRRLFQVLYAWPRREGESAPSISGMQINTPDTAQEVQNTSDREAAQLVIAERMIPDAFARRNSDAGIPVIALDSTGKVIGTMRLNTRGNEAAPSRATIRELQQLDPRFGTWRTAFSPAALKNRDGRTAEVTFAWLRSPLDPEPAE